MDFQDLAYRKLLFWVEFIRLPNLSKQALGLEPQSIFLPDSMFTTNLDFESRIYLLLK